ncbi:MULTISPECIES: hypothetical protein [Metallibacterium]|jgi:hypothetical protein|uniref:hypothetical protein n=1 Tax=Metallibacterium TaxID=1218803 RepID=UPI0026192114|nr:MULTISPECIES: hypothetical protein [Metallibacterium]MBW8075252.1 hypothetical protein [Metallibacterium scheffleri]
MNRQIRALVGGLIRPAEAPEIGEMVHIPGQLAGGRGIFVSRAIADDVPQLLHTIACRMHDAAVAAGEGKAAAVRVDLIGTQYRHGARRAVQVPVEIVVRQCRCEARLVGEG